MTHTTGNDNLYGKKGKEIKAQKTTQARFQSIRSRSGRKGYWGEAGGWNAERTAWQEVTTLSNTNHRIGAIPRNISTYHPALYICPVFKNLNNRAISMPKDAYDMNTEWV